MCCDSSQFFQNERVQREELTSRASDTIPGGRRGLRAWGKAAETLARLEAGKPEVAGTSVQIPSSWFKPTGFANSPGGTRFPHCWVRGSKTPIVSLSSIAPDIGRHKIRCNVCGRPSARAVGRTAPPADPARPEGDADTALLQRCTRVLRGSIGKARSRAVAASHSPLGCWTP